MTDTQLPRVIIITATASADERIALSRDTLPLKANSAWRWDAMRPAGTDRLLGSRRDEHGAFVTIEGSGSFIPDRPASAGAP